jgi:hypothetical protein
LLTFAASLTSADWPSSALYYVTTSVPTAMAITVNSILITRLGSLRRLIVRPESAVERYARPDNDLPVAPEIIIDNMVCCQYYFQYENYCGNY